jgi:phage terminase small subunit
VKKTSKKGTRAATAAKRAPKGATIPLKKICSELGLDPKASRVRLRRYLRSDEKGVAFHRIGSRWDLSPKEAKEVREFLAG